MPGLCRNSYPHSPFGLRPNYSALGEERAGTYQQKIQPSYPSPALRSWSSAYGPFMHPPLQKRWWSWPLHHHLDHFCGSFAISWCVADWCGLPQTSPPPPSQLQSLVDHASRQLHCYLKLDAPRKPRKLGAVFSHLHDGHNWFPVAKG